MTTMSSSYSPSLTHQHVLPIRKLPDCAISGQRLTENSPLLRAWLLDCGYGGMLWGDETLRSDRIGLEKAAIRILKWMLQAKKL